MSEETAISVPKSWLAETVALLDAMAGEGIEIDGCADPAILMTDLATALGVAFAPYRGRGLKRELCNV